MKEFSYVLTLSIPYQFANAAAAAHTYAERQMSKDAAAFPPEVKRYESCSNIYMAVISLHYFIKPTPHFSL
jgi:hypothetical protein